jgi:hypothetical protein
MAGKPSVKIVTFLAKIRADGLLNMSEALLLEASCSV